MKFVEYWKKFWNFLNEDSWSSFLVVLLIAFVVIKFVFFPILSFLTGTTLPLVIVESCSMYHQANGFGNTFTSDIYEDYGLSLDDTIGWDFQNGLNKGDVIFVIGADDIKVGDVIIFNAETQYRYPLIHRVISIENEIYSTKGDNYITNPMQLEIEKEINENQLVGKALFRVPAIGWLKLIFFESGRSPRDRGFCS